MEKTRTQGQIVYELSSRTMCGDKRSVQKERPASGANGLSFGFPSRIPLLILMIMGNSANIMLGARQGQIYGCGTGGTEESVESNSRKADVDLAVKAFMWTFSPPSVKTLHKE